MRGSLFFLLGGCALVLGACSSDPAIKADEKDARAMGGVVGHSVVRALNGADTMLAVVTGGGDPHGPVSDVDAFSDRPLALQEVADVEGATLPGKLGCRFVHGATGQTLMIARGDIDPGGFGRALVRNAGLAEPLSSATPGGFNALVKGTRLVGRGVVVAIQPTSLVSMTPGSGESTYPASLTVSADSGARQQYSGRWACGV